MQFAEVIAAGPGWTRVRGIDGKEYTLKGNRNWRNNNPGNLEYGNFAKSNDAIGTDGRFAVFPSFNEGLEAMQNLLFGSPKYADLSIEDAISRYAPAFENDTGQYVNVVANAAGVPPSTKLRDLSPEQRARFVQAQVQHEGFKPGRINGTPVPPTDIPFANNEVATALDTRPPPPHPFPRADMVTARREGIPRPRPAGDAQIARTFASLPSPPPMPVTFPNMAPPPSFGKVSFGAGSTTLEPQTLQPLPPEGVVQGRDITPPETVGRAGIESPFTRGSVASFPPSSTAFSPYPGMAAPPGIMRTNNGIAGTVQMPPGARPAGVDALLAQATAAQQPAMMNFSPQPRPPLPTQAQMQAIRAVPPQLLRQLTQQAPPLPRSRPASGFPARMAPTPMPPINRRSAPSAAANPMPSSAPAWGSPINKTEKERAASALNWIMNGA
jgi:hypothetical protein